MNTPDFYGAVGGALALAGGFLAALWHGVIVITLSFSIKVVPPWLRKAPEPKKAAAAPNSAAGAADAAPAPAAVPLAKRATG